MAGAATGRAGRPRRVRGTAPGVRGRRPPTTPPTFEDLPDKVLLRVLKELPQPDLLQVGRVSSRLHELSLDSALWRDLGSLGPSMPTEQMCSLLRSAPNLTKLCVHDRNDVDTILMEASRYCRFLEELQLTRCRGSNNCRGLAYVPLLKVAQNCRKLRRLHFRDTDFMCSRVFKVWVDLRGPGEPSLEIGVNRISRRQARYLTIVLNAPDELHVLANLGTPFVLHVHNHALLLDRRYVQGASDPSLAGPSDPCRMQEQHAVVEAGCSSCCTARMRLVRPAPSPSSSEEDVSGRPTSKRPCTELAADNNTPVDGVHSHTLVTTLVRSPSAPVSSARETDERRQLTDSPDDRDWHDDNMDVVAAPALQEEEEDVDAEVLPAATAASKTVHYRSLFGLGCNSEPPVESWFRSGYMPDCDSSCDSLPEDTREESTSSAARPPSSVLTDDEEDAVEVTEVVEEAVLDSLSAAAGVLPASAARIAASLKEPEMILPCGDLPTPGDPRDPRRHKRSAQHLAGNEGDHEDVKDV